MRTLAGWLCATLLSLFATVNANAGATPGGPESLIDAVPEAAVAAIVVRKNALSLLNRAWQSTPGLKPELGGYLAKRLGVDLTGVDSFAAWTTNLGPQGGFAVLAHLQQPGAIQGQVAGQFDGTDLVRLGPSLVAASVPSGLLIGTEDEVRVGIAVAHKKAPPVGARAALGAVASADPKLELIAGLAVSGLQDPTAQAMAQQYGVKLATLSYSSSSRIQLEVIGDGARLASAKTLIDSAVQVAIAQLKAGRDRALSSTTGDVAEGAAAIAAYHNMLAIWKELEPKIAGDRLVSAYQIPNLGTESFLVPAIGVAAAVAVPAFNSYVKKAKTSEATANTRRLADAAAAFAESGGPKKGKFAFPASTSWTPATGCCGQPDNKCAPNAAAWSGATWKALNFSVEEPGYYQYRVQSAGKGKNARIVVEARGDLDCDGKFSSWKREVTVDGQGAATIGALQSSDEDE